MSVQKLIKKEVLAMGGGSGTRVNVAPNPKLINLGAGDPDFNQPEFINKAVYDAMREGKTHYEFGGVPEFRKAIAEYYSKFGYAIKDPSGQIAIESGGSQAIFRAFGAILNPGDELILNEPTYGGYTQPAAFFGAKVVKAPMKIAKDGIYRPSIENLRKAITPKTKAFLYCNPDNPAGTVYTEDELKHIAEICIEKDIIAIADEIYVEFLWGNHKHKGIIGMPGMEDRSLVLMSFSKTFAWTGLRAGFVLGGPEIMKYVNQVPIGICGMPVPFQVAAAKALTSKEGWDFVGMMRTEYQKRVDLFVKRLNEMPGVSCPYPEGTFYVFPDISGVGMKSADFAAGLFKDESIRGAAGSGYGANGEGHIRFALVVPYDKCIEACDRIERFVKKNKK